MVKKIEDTITSYDRIHERGVQTDRRTDTAWQHRPGLHSIARQNHENSPTTFLCNSVHRHKTEANT